MWEMVRKFAVMWVFVVASSNLQTRDGEFLKFSPKMVIRFWPVSGPRVTEALLNVTGASKLK
jgi:hypothetical protein